MYDNVYIYDALRTPRGRGKSVGSLHEVTPARLLMGLFRELERRNDLDTAQVDSAVIGCVTATGEQGANVGKAALYASGWDKSIPAIHVNTFCASGLTATNIAAQRIASGSDDLVVSGGVESMSRVRMGMDGGAMSLDPEIALTHRSVPQGIGADLIATLDGVSREDADAYALRSQQLAAEAWKEGRFDGSIIPVRDDCGLMILDEDEHMRPETTEESLAGLRPAFQALGDMGMDALILGRYPHVERIEHVHTAGNSSGIVDGAALLLLGTREAGEKQGIAPRARILGSTLVSSDPAIMLTAPAPSTQKLLGKLGIDKDEVDLYEINEAFASVVLRFVSAMELPLDKVNVNGGAIAMGHPLGATGAIILGTLVDELERQGKRYGVATLCAAGGMGIATLIERVED